MPRRIRWGLALAFTLGGVLLLHGPLLRLPYFWDETGYYIPAALDFYRHGLLIPHTTQPTGHTPFLSVYLGTAWWLWGFSTFVTRVAMSLLAAGTIVALYALGRTFARSETVLWSCILLGLSPLFFAQSSLAFLDLPAALFTTWAVWALLKRRMAWFALTASLAVLTKETAVILLPVAALFEWRARRGLKRSAPLWLAVPSLPLIVWAFYYHGATGFWTGNAQYLQYNLYSTLHAGKIAVRLARRIYQVSFAGFNGLLVIVAMAGCRRMRKERRDDTVTHPADTAPESSAAIRADFYFLTGGLVIVYAVMLSLVGGAVLPRYLLPIFPCFDLALVTFAEHLPRRGLHAALAAVAVCFVASWFINPPYPFAYEDNLAYADFIELHQQAARYLSTHASQARILTAWPATDELTQPDLGYVSQPLRVTSLAGFTAQDFSQLSQRSFDWVYLYSRKWNPPNNWLKGHPRIRLLFDYAPAVPPRDLARRFHLVLLAAFHQRGQWVRIYSKRFPAARSRGIALPLSER